MYIYKYHFFLLLNFIFSITKLFCFKFYFLPPSTREIDSGLSDTHTQIDSSFSVLKV